MKEFLHHLAHVPYNSASPDLPDAYNDHRVWGLDCRGFAQQVSKNFPDFQLISGLYGEDSVHVAAVTRQQHDGHFYYVDGFLRMKEPLQIRPDVVTRAATHFSDFVVNGLYNSTDRTLKIALQLRDRCHSVYTFTLGGPMLSMTPHQYRFAVLHDGRPLTIEKEKRSKDPIKISAKGSDMDIVASVLQRTLGIDVPDVVQMFADAGENARYMKRLSMFVQ